MQKLNRLAICGCLLTSMLLIICILGNVDKDRTISYQQSTIDNMDKQMATMVTQVKQLQLDYADMQMTISNLPK